MIFKKGTEGSLSFLIGILLAIMIITPIIIVGYRAWAEKQGFEECYQKIIETSNELKEGQEKNIICNIPKDGMIIIFDSKTNEIKFESFTKVSSMFSNFIANNVGLNVRPPASNIQRYPKPKLCNNDQSCICICENVKWRVKPQDILEDYTFSCETPYDCTNFNNFEFTNTLMRKPGLHGLKLIKIKDKILICFSDDVNCDFTSLEKLFFFQPNLTQIKQQIELCKDKSELTKCDLNLEIYNELTFFVEDFAQEKKIGYFLNKDPNILTYLGSIPDLCVYNGSKITNFGLKRYVIDKNSIIKLKEDVCFITTEKNIPEEKIYSYKGYKTTSIGKPILEALKNCENSEQEKCVCDFEFEIQTDLKDIKYSFLYIDGEKRINFEGKDQDNLQQYKPLFLSLDDSFCFYNGTSKLKINQGDSFYFDNLRLIKLENDVCFTDENNLKEIDKCQTSVALR